MISRFLLFMVFFIVGTGLVLHFQYEIPYLPESIAKWIGHLPGDLIIKKEGATLYVPLTTSALLSGALSLLFRKGN